MGGVCTTACRPQIPKDENSPVKTTRSYFKRKKVFSGGFNLARGSSSNELYSCEEATLAAGGDRHATIDINRASEEDLMIVPGVNRELAHCIIEYRKQLGFYGFRDIHDLAPCVGAVKLAKLKKELHVSPVHRKAAADSLSTKSLASSITVSSTATSLLNINRATISQLASVAGLGEQAARDIVQYRQLHGKYQTLNDLVDPAAVLDVHTFHKVKENLCVTGKRHYRNFSSVSNQHTSLRNSTISESSKDYVPPSLLRPAVAVETMTTTVVASSSFNGRPIVRICSWNLEACSREKIRNPGVREVFCVTLLKRNCNVAAVHDFSDANVLTEIVAELNHPTLPNVQRLVNSRSSCNGKWKSSSDFADNLEAPSPPGSTGFIWNEHEITDVEFESLLRKNGFTSATGVVPKMTSVYIGTFKVSADGAANCSVGAVSLGNRG